MEWAAMRFGSGCVSWWTSCWAVWVRTRRLMTSYVNRSTRPCWSVSQINTPMLGSRLCLPWPACRTQRALIVPRSTVHIPLQHLLSYCRSITQFKCFVVLWKWCNFYLINLKLCKLIVCARIFKAYMLLLENDSNPEVRRAVLSCIAPSALTLPKIYRRTRDVKEKIRKLAYQVHTHADVHNFNTLFATGSK